MAKSPTKPSRTKGRRARGTGTIFLATRRGKPVWIGRKPVGRTADGKTAYKEVWGRTQAEVVRKLATAGPPAADTTVAAWAARWLASISVRPATYEGYESDLRLHVLPAIGHLRVADVRPSHLERLAVTLVKGGMHPNTARKALSTARTVFTAAVRDELIARNPVTHARKPKRERGRIDPLPADQLAAIVAAAPAYAAGPLVALLAGIGCRLGEAAALDVPDWNPGTGQLSITKTYSVRFGLGPPKSVHSTRTVTVPDLVRPHLDAAAGGRTTGPLFLTGAGGRFQKSGVELAFTRALKRLGLPRRNVHQLRHSVASALIAAGEPLADVAKYLGDTVKTLVDTYLHATGSDPGRAMNAILGGRQG
jgi:integrase